MVCGLCGGLIQVPKCSYWINMEITQISTGELLIVTIINNASVTLEPNYCSVPELVERMDLSAAVYPQSYIVQYTYLICIEQHLKWLIMHIDTLADSCISPSASHLSHFVLTLSERLISIERFHWGCGLRGPIPYWWASYVISSFQPLYLCTLMLDFPRWAQAGRFRR